MTSDAMPVANQPLGKRLFEEEPAWTVLPTLLMVIGPLLLLFIFLGIWREGWRTGLAWGIVWSVALLFLGVHLQYLRVLVHENGVLRKTVLGRRELLFANVAAVQQWDSRIRLLPAEGGGKPFTLRQSREAEDLRDRLAMRFEARLLQQLEEQGEVQWGANVWLSRAGIRWSGSEGESLLPLSSSLRITIDPSYCRVYHPSRNLVPTLAISDAGFLPGLLLLQRLMKESPPAEARSEPAGAEGLGEALGEIRSRWVAPLAVFLICLGLGGRDLLAWIETGDPSSLVLWGFFSFYALQSLLLHGRIDGHQNGLSIRPRLGRRREILFSEVRGLRSEKSFGWYGESTGFDLLDARGRAVGERVLTRNNDPAPGMLRDRIAESVADSLLVRMAEEGLIRWGADSRLSREWIHGRDASGIERSIHLSRGLRFTSGGGRLRLYPPDSSEAFLFLDLSHQDAYPGLLVLQQLIEEAQA